MHQNTRPLQLPLVSESKEKNTNTLSRGPKKTPGPHRKFVEFWHDTVPRVRRSAYLPSGADMRRLKQVIDLRDRAGNAVINELQLEQLGLYYLAGPRFQKLPPTIAVFLSGGVLTGLMNTAQTDPEFWKTLDGYMQRYLSRPAEGDAAKVLQQIRELKMAAFKVIPRAYAG